jgi:probable rRNA maturation factor
VKIAIKNLQKKIPVTALTSTRIKKAILKTCLSEDVRKPGEITVCLVNDRAIKEFNLNYLAQNNPTDVLAFDFNEGGRILADIMISTDTASRNARIFKTSPLRELYLYVIHGMLHILGYDDESTGERKVMDKKAAAILGKLCL